MKRISLIVLACSVVVLPSALSGQIQKDGSAARNGANQQGASVTSADRCGTRASEVLSDGKGPFAGKGKCSCEIITGARVRGCTGTTQLECEAQTCTYERINVFTGEVTETGNMECAWTEGYPS
jgi:hypothetical protein